MPKPKFIRAGAALLILSSSAAMLAPAHSAAPQNWRDVDGNNVTRVGYSGGGAFAESGEGRWIEYDSGGSAIHSFEESGRDASTVTLYDRPRRTTVVIDLGTREIRAASFNNPMRTVYLITNVESRRGGWGNPRTNIPWDRNGLAQVEAGPIWSQGHAERRCADKAIEIGADWTGQWHTTRPGQMSVCEMRRRPGERRGGGGGGRRDEGSWNPRDGGDVDVGPIWNQADAVRKCGAKAREMGVQWTGSWTSRNGTSVCGMRGKPFPVPSPSTGGVTRTFEVGPLWNQGDAQVKCTAKARDVQGEWTGQWWTTVPNRMSVCEIRFR